MGRNVFLFLSLYAWHTRETSWRYCFILLVNICTVFHMNPAVALFSWYDDPTVGQASSLSRLHDHKHTHTHKFGRTALDEWSDRRKILHLTTQHSQQTPMPPAAFEPATPTSDWLQNHTWDRTGSGIGRNLRVRNRKYAKIQVTCFSLSLFLSLLSTPYWPAQYAVFPFMWYAAVLQVATSVW